MYHFIQDLEESKRRTAKRHDAEQRYQSQKDFTKLGGKKSDSSFRLKSTKMQDRLRWTASLATK
jgi:hypothetical protein